MVFARDAAPSTCSAFDRWDALVEFVVSPALAGSTASELEFPGEVRISAVSRGSRTFERQVGLALCGAGAPCEP